MAEDILRILIISNRYLPVVGGAERQADLLGRALQARGHEVQVVTRRLVADLPSQETINGLPVRRLHPIGLSRLANILMVFRLAFFLIRHSKQYDFFHCQGVGPVGLATILAARLSGTPCLVRAPTAGDLRRRADSAKGVSFLIRGYVLPDWLWRRLLRQSGAVVAISEEIAQESNFMGLSDTLVKIPNGVNNATFSPLDDEKCAALRLQYGFMPNDNLFITAGRFIPRKRFDIVIRAFAQTAKDTPGAKLVILGEGNPQASAELQTLAQEMGVAQQVIFAGMVDTMRDYLAIGDCFLFASNREGMPNVILEAMASGIPIIATRIGGVVDLLDDELAILTEADDLTSFAGALQDFLDDRPAAQERAKAARQRVEQHFSHTTIAGRYEALYRRLIAEKANKA